MLHYPVEEEVVMEEEAEPNNEPELNDEPDIELIEPPTTPGKGQLADLVDDLGIEIRVRYKLIEKKNSKI